jgi:hypothetical protein
MRTSLRSWWRNCALSADAEVLEIDRIENRIAPLSPDVTRIRKLISSLELCHHKADRWVTNIIEAIGAGTTQKGLGTRQRGRSHPVERVWQNACKFLSAWCAGCPSAKVDLSIDTVPSSRLFEGLGSRSPLKEWQVQRVIEKIRSVIHWPRSLDDPSSQYVWILLSGGDYECAYRTECPQAYKEHEEFWLKTVRTLIHDTENGHKAEISLGLAIDMLWPCHWSFLTNLQIVCDAIGGRLHPDTPFAACGRNIGLLPIRPRMETVSNTLKAYYGAFNSIKEMDKDILAKLGKQTEEKRWLAASLDKTIRLQLCPPSDLRAISALSGPDWLKK